MPRLSSFSFALVPLAAAAFTTTSAEAYTAYVTNEKDNTISVIDTDTMKVIKTAPVGHRPRGIVMSKDKKWIIVCTSDDNDVKIYDAKTLEYVKSLPSGPDPELLALHPDGERLYIANENDNLVTVVNIMTGQVISEIPVGVEPEGMGMSPDGKVLVNTSETTNMAHFIDTEHHRTFDNVLLVSTIDSLIRLRRIRPVLVVGIPNTQRRRDLTGPTTVHSDSAIAPRVGGSAAFRRFIRSELMPEIRRRYRSSDETGIVGESLAGLFVVETLLLEPALFRHYIAFDPAVWWNNKEMVRTAEARLAAFPPGKRQLYLGAANTPGIGEETRELAGILKAHAPRALAWSFEPRPDLDHSTIFRALAPGAFVKLLH